MDREIASGLAGVEETMLLPLWGRYSESIREHGLLRDRKCEEIVGRLGLDFSIIAAQQQAASRLAWIARAWNADREIGKLLASESELTVINLGCGLDTAFHRLDTGALFWYDVDLPNVIRLRRSLFDETPRYRMISGSVLDEETFSGIEIRGTPIVLAVGLLYYFTDREVRSVFSHCAGLGDEVGCILDFCSPRGVEMANRLVLQNCSGARMLWSVEESSRLQEYCGAGGVVESYPLFRHIAPLLSADEQNMAAASDAVPVMSFGVLSIRRRPAA